MPLTVATDQLTAVNKILSMIGQAPVSQATLDSDPQPPDVAAIVSLIDEFDLAVQEQGWGWNEETATLAPESDSTILVPEDTINVHRDKEKEVNTNPMVRGSILFDRKNRTTLFSNPVKVILVKRLTFTDLPEAVRKYIIIRAGRAFVSSFDNSEIIWQYSKDQENEARDRLTEDTIDSNDYGLGNSREHLNYKRFSYNY